MHVFLGGLMLAATITLGSSSPEPPPPPPPPQGTNKGLLPEPMLLTSLIDAINSRKKNEGDVSNGPYIKFGTGVSGAGWISTGPGYRQLFGDRFLIDASAVVSWRQYMSGRARAELRPLANRSLTIGGQVLAQDWTQVQFYGLGEASSDTNRSHFRLRATDVSAYATLSPARAFDVRVRSGLLSRPKITGATGWNKGDYPDTQALFSEGTAPGLTAQPRYWHADISVSSDTLDHPDHPTRGVMIEAGAARYRDRDLSRYSFRRYDVTTVAFVPLIGNLWTIGVRGMAVASDTSDGHEVPFYMMPSLGKSVLRGFDTDRFRDRHMAAVNVESRWAIFQHLDAAVFADFGRVASRFRDLQSDFESSYGIGLRLHTGAATFLRVDAARTTGGGGWRVVVKMKESLGFSRDQRWATVVPVVR
jgi:hypothetical protein